MRWFPSSMVLLLLFCAGTGYAAVVEDEVVPSQPPVVEFLPSESDAIPDQSLPSTTEEKPQQALTDVVDQIMVEESAEALEEEQSASEAFEEISLDEEVLGEDEEWEYVYVDEEEEVEPQPATQLSILMQLFQKTDNPMLFGLPLLGLFWFLLMRISRVRSANRTVMRQEEEFNDCLSIKGRKAADKLRAPSEEKCRPRAF